MGLSGGCMRLSGGSMGIVSWTIRGRLYGVWLIGIGMRCWPCRWSLTWSLIVVWGLWGQIKERC